MAKKGRQERNLETEKLKEKLGKVKKKKSPIHVSIVMKFVVQHTLCNIMWVNHRAKYMMLRES